MCSLERQRRTLFGENVLKDSQMPGGAWSEMAASVPGAYFLYSPLSHSILAKIDTGKQLQSARLEKKAALP